jgi:alpha-amylase/alpha-mannosidase (GH57 family)
MHQPHYFNNETDRYELPWTYLHAIKDYVDMASLIEATPGARAVVNFAPTLLEQIDDYAEQVALYLDEGRPLKDPLLAALASSAATNDPQQRLGLVKACLRANRKRLIDRYAPFKELADMAVCIGERTHLMRYLDDQYLADLLVWYHLAWLGETVRRRDRRVQHLMDKGRGFTLQDRRRLLELIGDLLGDTIAAYRRLADAGRIELSVSPYAHPILPLLINLESAREAMPDAPLPHTTHYPGGAERVRWHIQEGLRVFERHFGRRPRGCWPSEGGVSRAAVHLLEEAGFEWVATGESVLHNSLRRSQLAPACIHRPYRLKDSKTHCFFRDDGLSDLIGFSYSEWHADDAANNMVHHLENIAVACRDEPNRVVPIILDGENAWESYPENGYHFLSALYKRLAEHPRLELTTFADCIDAGLTPIELPELVAGSWVYGTFSTWIGDKDKNRGWDLLIEAKRAFDEAVASGRLKGKRLERASHRLAVCEGSDWFWWFGDYNPAESVRDFDRLFRLQLAELYRLIGKEPPEYLGQVISQGGGAPAAGGVMRRGKEEH